MSGKVNRSKTTENNSIEGNSHFYGWVVLAVSFFTLVLGYAVRNSFSVFYPAIIEEFGWGRGNTALMFSINIIVYGFTAPLAGRLIDRFEPRIVIPAGSFILGGGIAMCSFASSQWHFYLFFGIIMSAGLGMVGWTPLTTIISTWFARRRGLAFGVMSAGIGGSFVVAPVAQFLISSFGWRHAYVIIGVSSIAFIAPLCGLLVRRKPQNKGLLPDNISHTKDEFQNSVNPGIAGGLEGRWPNTTWTLSRALMTYQFWLLFIIAFCVLGLAEQIAIPHQIYFFRDVGYGPMLAAKIFSVFGIAFVLGNLCSGFSDRLGREKVFIPGCLLSAGAVLLLFMIRDASYPWMSFMFALCFGLGLGVSVAVLFATVADLFQGSNFGSIQGTVILGFSLGGALAPWVAGFLHDRTNSYFTTFFILLGSFMISIVLMLFIAPRKIRPVHRSG